MTKEQLRMQMLAGIITESQYKAILNEDNQPEFTNEIKVNNPKKGRWNGWELAYAQDDIFYIHPANSFRPWMDGRTKNGIAVISVEKSDDEVVEKFLQDLGNQLGATPYDGDYDNIELRVNEQDLDSLFNY